MTKIIKILLPSLISFNSFGQSIKEIEIDLTSFPGKITYIPKIDKARGLLNRDSFNYIAIRYILDYYQESKIDSVSLFLDNLIKTYPNKVDPLILRTEFLPYEHNFKERSAYTKWKIFYLDSAYRIDKKNPRTLNLLSEAYYRDFIYPLEKGKKFNLPLELNIEEDSILLKKQIENKKSAFEYSADSALLYFYKLWQTDTEIRNIIYYPIRQLECYLQKAFESKIPLNVERDFEQCYFPSWYFANLKDNWQCDSTVDYLFALESSVESASWLKTQLEDLNEPCIYDTVRKDDTKIMRFTWLRSFHHPVSIRLEKKNNNIVLIWKIGMGAGGYSPKGLKAKGIKRISRKKWNNISTLLEKTKIERLQNEYYVAMTDGASWTLEIKDKNGYKAHKTNRPSNEFKEICLYLLRLTNIKVKKGEIY